MAEKKSTKKNGEARKAPAPSIPAEEFVTKWEAAANLAEAKKVLGDGASSRAARMRAAGVPLKEMAGGGRKMNVTALAALIGRPALPPKPKKVKETASAQ